VVPHHQPRLQRSQKGQFCLLLGTLSQFLLTHPLPNRLSIADACTSARPDPVPVELGERRLDRQAPCPGFDKVRDAGGDRQEVERGKDEGLRGLSCNTATLVSGRWVACPTQGVLD